ncbi:Transcription factor [Macleaya cordata]|uniref:Transcription factor n=1 Tax=Macleaya cordata TaxID=56857 RepID=A0A200QSV6_MACCD|nr:Transcription factor [Macleaya cordata]
METKIGGKAQNFCSPGTSDFVSREKELKAEGKRSSEWDLNSWNWDGDLFIASPLNSAPPDRRSKQLFPITAKSNSSSSCSDEINLGSEKEKRELEKRRKVIVIEDDKLNEEAGNLTLKLGRHESEGTNPDGNDEKKTELRGETSNRAICQVENCGADLSNAKDYHRRHKVCEMHSKASGALVGNVMQRFCQQCSRFHVLQEFDKDKRSCRRRLAGHNRRRRKTHPDTAGHGTPLNEDQASSYPLISLLRILSNMHSSNTDQLTNKDLLSHFLRNLAGFAGIFGGSNLSGLLQETQDFLTTGASAGRSSKIVPALLSNLPEPSRILASTSNANGSIDAQGLQIRPMNQYGNVDASEMPQKGIVAENARGVVLQTVPSPKSKTLFPIRDSLPVKTVAPETRMIKLNNIDLNNISTDSEDCIDGLEMSQQPGSLGTGSLDSALWLQKDTHQPSPPQTSGNSDSERSPSSSNGDARSRTDRIVFKLFGKDPNDFPLALRAQILDWLSHTPTDIESYIKPGCIILTIYLRLAESTWEELCGDLSSTLSALLDAPYNTFWRTGWIYTRVQHQIAFIYNGQVVLDTPLSLKREYHRRISSVIPIAVSVSERAQFIVKGFNLLGPSTRLLCALEGKYLLHEVSHDLVEDADTFKKHDELQFLSFPCSIPDIIGRGFIEVEDHGLSNSFFPFIVAEEDVCSDIRMLESAIEVAESGDSIHGTSEIEAKKNQALDFIHEMGWLLHRSRLRSRLGDTDSSLDVFPSTRFRWLMEFSMDRDWCGVVKKLLEILFNGTVGSGEHSSVELALLEMGLLHRAVRRSCRPMVELLLRFVPDKASDTEGSELKPMVDNGSKSFLFRPDAAGPAGLTPLHIAAGTDGSENILDALTDDPGQVGVEAWKKARDDTGYAPEDYALLRGHFAYIHLVQKKIDKKSETGHLILDIPWVEPLDCSNNNHQQKQTDKLNSAKPSGFQIDKTETRPNLIQQPSCKLCHQQVLVHHGNTRRLVVHRSVMLSMVAIAAVCVCVALLFKSSPEVLCVFSPFRWELLDYGSI